MLRQIVTNQRFAFVDLLLVAMSGAIWVLIPELGVWFTLIALLPWALRLLAGNLPFQRTPFDWFVAIFLITAWVGYWAAYDKTTAWIKVWLIVNAILLYYALSAQPKQNLEPLSLLSFCLGLSVAFYFFLTFNFTGSPGSIALWWMNIRPQIGWHAIHHGYTSGLLVITNLFALYWLWNTRQKLLNRFTIASKVFLIFGLGMILWAFVLTMSRGIWAATACGLGVWVLWKIAASNRFITQRRMRSLFPVLVLGFLSAIIIFVYLGPAKAGGGATQSDYGKNSRAELFERGAYFLADYPITGSGLNSFPGLYSQYMIGIPYFYFLNSYNLFLDIAIEQGITGGLAFILIYVGSIWLVSQAIIKAQSQQMQFINWLSMFILIVTFVHGLFYDYLYSGDSTLLLFFPIGISMIGVLNLDNPDEKVSQLSDILPWLKKRDLRMFVIVLAAIVGTILVLNFNNILSMWYANLGSVQMSQVELEGFPNNGWSGSVIVSRLNNASASFHSSLWFDPDNRTANQGLGIIFMLSQDFESASSYLETARLKAPDHRGIIKSLGYCYVWLGDIEKATSFLSQVPEANEELNAYVWWWKMQGRDDLSEKAFNMLMH